MNTAEHSSRQSILPALSRRRFLGGVAITAIPSAAIAVEVGKPCDVHMTAQERFDFHLAEFKRAAEELDPMIGDWLRKGQPGDEGGCVIFLSAFRRTGQYDGDGLYERGNPCLPSPYQVRLIDGRIDGERMFEVTRLDEMTRQTERMQMTESRLNTFIGRRRS